MEYALQQIIAKQAGSHIPPQGVRGMEVAVGLPYEQVQDEAPQFDEAQTRSQCNGNCPFETQGSGMEPAIDWDQDDFTTFDDSFF